MCRSAGAARADVGGGAVAPAPPDRCSSFVLRAMVLVPLQPRQASSLLGASAPRAAPWGSADVVGTLWTQGIRTPRRRSASDALEPVEPRYLIRTFGCQMNRHDSERIAGLLSSENLCACEYIWRPRRSICSPRTIWGRTPTTSVYWQPGTPSSRSKAAAHHVRIVVSGCLARSDREIEAFWVDRGVGTTLPHRSTRGAGRARLSPDGCARVHRDVPQRAARCAAGSVRAWGVDRAGLRQRLRLLHRSPRTRASALPPDR